MKIGNSFKWLLVTVALANQVQANDRFFTENEGWTPFGSSLLDVRDPTRNEARQEMNQEKESFYQLMLDQILEAGKIIEQGLALADCASLDGVIDFSGACDIDEIAYGIGSLTTWVTGIDHFRPAATQMSEIQDALNDHGQKLEQIVDDVQDLKEEVESVAERIDELNNAFVRLHLMKYSSEISFIMRTLQDIQEQGALFISDNGGWRDETSSFMLAGDSEITGDTFADPLFPNIKEHLLDAEQELMSANAFLPGFMDSLQPSEFELIDSVVALHEVTLGMWVVAELTLKRIYEERLDVEITDMHRQLRLMEESIVDAQAAMANDYADKLVIENYAYSGTRSCVCYESYYDWWWTWEKHYMCDVDCHYWSSGSSCMKKLVDYSYEHQYLMDSYVPEMAADYFLADYTGWQNYYDSSCQNYLKVYDVGNTWMEIKLDDIKTDVLDDYRAAHVAPSSISNVEIFEN